MSVEQTDTYGALIIKLNVNLMYTFLGYWQGSVNLWFFSIPDFLSYSLTLLSLATTRNISIDFYLLVN